MRAIRSSVLASLLTTGVLAASAPAQAYTPTLLPVVGGGGYAYWVGGTPSVITGMTITLAPFTGHPARWDNGVLTPLIEDVPGASYATRGVDSVGNIYGSRSVGAVTQSLKWLSGGAPIQLAALPGAAGAAGNCPDSWISDVSPNGTAIGCSNSGASAYGLAAKWVNNVPAALTSPAGATHCEGRGIADNGFAAGSCTFATGSRAVQWSTAGVPTVLPLLKNGTWSKAVRVTGDGRVAGSGDAGAGSSNGIVWSLGVAKKLPKLNNKTTFWEAQNLNAAGDAVGDANGGTNNGGTRHAVLWPFPYDTAIELPTPGALVNCYAYDIDDQGVIVGTCSTAAGYAQPVRWDP